MKKMFVSLVLMTLLPVASLPQAPQNAPAGKPVVGLLSTQELKQIMPPSVFFAGQTAPVQLRNSGGFRTPQGKLVLIAMVDSSGYSSGVAQKYQAYLISEISLRIEGKALPAGAYGVGFLEGDVFNVMDVGGKDIFSASGHSDAALRRAVPLKLVADAKGGFRLYFGKHYAEFSVE